MCDLRLAGNHIAHPVVESDKSNSILLAHKQVGEGRREFTSVVELQDSLGASVVHAATGIEHDGGAEIRLLVIFSYVKAITAAKHLPI